MQMNKELARLPMTNKIERNTKSKSSHAVLKELEGEK